MSSPSNIDLVEVTGILKELSELSKEGNNNGSDFIPDRLSGLNGNQEKYQTSSDSDSGITATQSYEKMSDGEMKQAQLSARSQEDNAPLVSSKEDVSIAGEVEDGKSDGQHIAQTFDESVEDELASRVVKSLADMQDILDNVSEELDLSGDNLDGDNHEYMEDVLVRDGSQEDIIDLTLTGLEREIIIEENEEMISVTGADSGDEEGSHLSYDSAQELKVGDSAAQCQLLEQRLRLERNELKGEETGSPDLKSEETQSEASSSSDDSLHRQVERSLAGSTCSLNQTIVASEHGSDHSEEYSSTIQGMNSRDELEIYDSSDLQNGVHQLMNGAVPGKEHSKTPPNASGVPAIFTINQLKRKFDSVDNIMDRIDAGISTLRTVEMPARDTSSDDIDQSEVKSAATADNPAGSGDHWKAPQLQDNIQQLSTKPYSKSAPNFNTDWQTSLKYGKTSFLQDEREESDGIILSDEDVGHPNDDDDDNMADEDSFGLSGADNLSDLDSDAASATNAKFSEILRNKHNTLGDPRVVALKHREAGTETESIRTEDFETAFQKSLPADRSLKSLQTHSLAESTDTPLTEDFEERFQSSLKFSQIPLPDTNRRPPASIYNLPKAKQSFITRSSPVNKRRSPTITKRTPTPPKRTVASRNAAYSGIAYREQELQKGVDTLDELSDIEPEVKTRMRPTSPHHAAPIMSNGYYEADTESEDGEFAQQIREQSNRIQKEIELERRLKTRQVQRAGSNPHPQMAEFPASEQPGYSSMDTRHNSLPRYRCSASHTNLPSAQEMHAFHSYSASTPDVSLLAHQNSNLMKNQLEEESTVVKRLNDDRMQLLQEISRLQEELKGMEEEVQSTELQAKENRTRAEESRSHLMVAEFKKEAVLKEINRLSGEVDQSRRIIEEAQEKKEQEDTVLNSLGLTIQQVPGIIEDRDAQRQKVENIERAAEKEKDDRVKQVESIKTEAATMQENLQEKIDTLRDSVQRLNAHLERVTTEKDEFKKERDTAISKCDSLQRDMAAGEHAKAQALEQTIKGYDDMRRRLEKDSAETHTQLTNEQRGIKKLLEIEEQKGAKLREEIELRDELNESLREQLRGIRQKASEEDDSHEQLVKGLKQQLRDSDNERLAAWDACKKQFEVEKDKLLEMTREDMERQHMELLSAVREEHARQVSQLQHANKNKESEAYMLRDRLSEQEQEAKRNVETLRAEARRQVEEAIQSEKKIWEKEQKYIENQQLKEFREKEENQLSHVRLQLESECRKRQQVEDQLSSIKMELEESAQHNQRLHQEKQGVAQKLKNAEDNQTEEINKSKKELKQHYEKMMAALREEMDEKEQEIARLRHENSSIAQSEAESSQALEKFEKIMIHEINEECKKTADLLGVQPRKAQTVSFSRSSSPSKGRARKRSASRSVTASAVANLRACNDELRNSLAEIKSEVSELGETASRSEKAKELELEQLRNKLSNEKRQEVEDMRMSLAKQEQAYVLSLRQSSSTAQSSALELSELQSHSTNVDDTEGECNCMPACRRSLNEPRDSYQVKVERKASEKALRKSLSGSYTALNGNATDYYQAQSVDDPRESTASHSMQNVQDRLRHIRAGSPFRYRSNPALANSGDTAKYSPSNGLSSAGMESLEQKVRLAELKARLADERANRNQAILSQKMHEVNELQQTLNHQTKEIMGLERSYDDYRSSQYSPSRYSTLNSTFPH